MCVVHKNNYDTENCLDCIKEENYQAYFDRLSYAYPDPVNYLEETDKGKFINGNFAISLYKNPGDSVFLTVAPNKFVGKLIGLNSKKNWIAVDRGGTQYWIINDKRLTAVSPDPNAKPLTTSEKIDVVAGAASAGGGPIAGAIVKGGGNAGNAVAEILPDLGTIKWVLVVVVVLIIMIMIYKITK